MELLAASAVIRMFWNVPRGTFPPEVADEPPDVSASVFLRSENDSNAAAIGLALRLSELLPAGTAALPPEEPRSRESSRDWVLSTPGAICFVAASAVPPDR